MFEAAWNLKLDHLRENLLPILALAVVGVSVSAGVVGVILHFAIGLLWSSALLFGAMISATDPISVLALFKKLGAPRRLTTIIEGESLFNDGTAVVIFRIMGVWGVLLVLTVLLVAAAAKFPYFPGDVALTKLVQSLNGESVGWAQTVTNTVRTSSVYVLVALSVALSWWLGGWRAALVALLSFGVLWQAEPWLKSLVARPRLSPALVRVVGSSSGYSFPSGFALIYFSTIGWLAVLAYHRLTGKVRWVSVLLGGLILLVGGSARLALGAHWPSDIYGAYLIGLVWR